MGEWTETERRRAERHALWTEAFRDVDLAGRAVLDAGCGEGWFTRFLAERLPGRLVSITAVAEEIEPARERAGGRAGSIEFRVADLTRMPEIPAGSFDVVGADFLLAAVSAYSPYREIDCLRELARVLRPGGRLVLTGWEASPRRVGAVDAAIREAFALREAVDRLAGIDSFREHPRSWVLDRLSEIGLPVERVTIRPDIHRSFSWFLRQIGERIERLPEPELRDALASRLSRLEDVLIGAPEFEAGYEFGRLYAIVSLKIGGASLLDPGKGN